MTRSCTLRPRARQDLEDIWDYTAGRFGLAQAEAYVRALWHEIVLVGNDPMLGRSSSAIREGYRKRTSGSHVVFYRATESGIEVVRILHRRMDVERHLD